MRSDHSFGIDFLIRKCKADKKMADIYARITIDEERKEIAMKEQIQAIQWDSKAECVKGKTEAVKTLNRRIEDVRHQIREKYRELCDKQELITAESVKQSYLGNNTRLKGHKMQELLTYFEKIWSEKLKDFKNYRTTIKYVSQFLEQQSPSGDIYLSQVDMQFITDLEHFIRTNPIKPNDPCAGNGMGKNIQRFKRILSWAKELRWLTENPCKEYSCPLKKTKRKKLTIRQIMAIENQQFADPTIQYVRALFLNSVYTGFAFADATMLKEEHFEWNTDGRVWCLLYRQKSDELTAIPILKYAAVILNQYRNQADFRPGGTLFPKITNQTVNKALKIIQAVCGIPFNLTFHIARHTFATTIALKNGIPIETVQIMMGHQKITTTKIYAEVDEEKVDEDTQGWEEKIAAKKDITLAAQQLQNRSEGLQHWAN